MAKECSGPVDDTVAEGHAAHERDSATDDVYKNCRSFADGSQMVNFKINLFRVDSDSKYAQRLIADLT